MMIRALMHAAAPAWVVLAVLFERLGDLMSVPFPIP